MTERDNFILRWARLKRTSDTGHKTDPSGDKPPGSVEAGVAGAEATVAQPGIDVAADEPLALASLLGIAENQWDFNDPNAIPGFGPLPAADGMPAVLAQPPGRHDEPAEMILETPASAEQSLQAATGHERADLDQREQQTFNGSQSTDDCFRGLPDDGNGEHKATKNNRAAEGDGSPRNHRSHGSALPR
jgi:hypothetical protein